MPDTVQTRLAPVDYGTTLQRAVFARDDPLNQEEYRRRLEKHGVPVQPELPEFDGESINRRYRRQKQTLHFRENQGSFIKPWESPDSIVGRDEWCLTPVEGCPLDCSYCYLQDYLDEPLIQVFTNQDTMADHVRGFLEDPPEEPPHFFSLGELSDGLFLEPLLRSIPRVWDTFRDSDAKLEVRSKSHHVHGLPGLIDPHPNGVFTWTLTPSGPDQRDEMLTAPVEQRLAALRHMKEAGFRVAARLDPILLRENWREDYARLIGRLAEAIDLDELTFLLLGVFRFPRGFDHTMEERFPNREFLRDEFVEGPDGKLRYARDRRVEVYRQLGELVRDHRGDPNLCMEPEYVWEDAGFMEG